MTNMVAIETTFQGYRFRRRLEARWAVWFSQLGLIYEYEREGYDLDGLRYLPDFWIPAWDVFVEIKGNEPTPLEKEKSWRLARMSRKTVFLFWRGIGDGSTRINVYDPTITGSERAFTFCSFGECGRCHGVCLLDDLMPGTILWHLGRDRHALDGLQYFAHVCDSEILMQAFRAARSARFEFGETPR